MEFTNPTELSESFWLAVVRLAIAAESDLPVGQDRSAVCTHAWFVLDPVVPDSNTIMSNNKKNPHRDNRGPRWS